MAHANRVNDANLRQYYLQQMGLTVWVERQTETAKALARLTSEGVCALRTRGNPEARLMIVCPEPDERAAALLDRMLRCFALQEEDWYQIYLSKEPTTDELTSLARQLQLLTPSVLLNLLPSSNALSCSADIIPSLSPDRLLARPQEKKKAWQDWCRMSSLLGRA